MKVFSEQTPECPAGKSKRTPEVQISQLAGPTAIPRTELDDLGLLEQVISRYKASEIIAYCGALSLLPENASHRRAGSPRHRHRDGLVQIANELAAQGLCDPLIPSATADTKSYLRAFSYRLTQTVASIKQVNTESLVCVLVDAADNAEMISQELGDGHSFIRDLMAEPLIPGVRLVVLSRTERRHLLDAPSTTVQLKLEPFQREETAELLRCSFPTASEGDVDEFHRLTSRNPRVQAAALAQGNSLSDILRDLGPNPKTVDDMLANLLENAMKRLKDSTGAVERSQIEGIASALSVLRPFVPISVVAQLAGVHESAVRSFAADIGRPLLIAGDAIQFRDEPTETWFRQRFRPQQEELAAFIEKLKPLASGSAYVASALPQLMLEAGQLSELVQLALSSAGLPSEHPLERRDVELQRLHFALKASLRAKRYADSVKLALKAGEETVGDTRQRKLFQDNTDLLSCFMSSGQVEAIVARHPFSGTWHGGHHAYEAAILANIPDFLGDARSRLRMAHDWVWNWSRLSDEERQQERIEDIDVANMAAVEWKLEGAAACADAIQRWRPRQISFRVGLILSRHCVDHTDFAALNELAIAADTDFYLVLAIALELRRVHRYPPREAVEKTLHLIEERTIEIGELFGYREEPILGGINAIIQAAHHYGLADRQDLASTLSRYLPSSPPRLIVYEYGRGRTTVLAAYALRAALAGEVLDLWDLAPADLRKEKEDSKSHSESSDLREFKEKIGALFPWHKLRAEQIVAQMSSAELTGKLAETSTNSTRAFEMASRYRSFTSDEIAEVWFDILTNSQSRDANLMVAFKHWAANLPHPLFTPTWTNLARVAARTSTFEVDAHEFARKAFDLIHYAKEDAESKAQTYVGLSRALLNFDSAEAEQYFSKALEVVSRLGDEVLDRWAALLDLADRAADPQHADCETAYRLARCAEIAEAYDSKHFQWRGTIEAVAALSPQAALATLSRWRDRRFGSFEKLLPITIEYLVDAGRLDPLIGPALVGFQAEWNHTTLLRKSLPACEEQAQRDKVFRSLFRYMRLEPHGFSEWTSLRDIAADYGISDSHLEQQIELARQHSILAEERDSRQRQHTASAGVKQEQPRWNEVFDGLLLECNSGFTEAYHRFRAADHYPRHDFFKQVLARTTIGKEADLIRAFASSVEFDLYDFRGFFELLPTAWKSRLAVQAATKDAIKLAFARFCMDVTRSRYYELFPVKLAAEMGGVPEDELTDVALDALSTATETMDSGRLFSLIGILAQKISRDEALSGLRFGLTLFETVVTDDDGDGPWTHALEPPASANEALGGLVYAALAAPQSGLRWQAAHVVRALCILGRAEVVSYIIRLTAGTNGGPFSDAKLHFYHLHARQWLLIALARAALETPEFIATYEKLLRQYALDEFHVVIRHFASEAMLNLFHGGFITLDSKTVGRLKNINKPSLPVQHTKQYDRLSHQLDMNSAGESEERFRFAYDIDRYWFEPLGECFAVRSTEIERIAESVIWEDWKLSNKGGWKEDERAQRDVFRERETWHSHSSYPKADDLTFYLSYHAMMVAAGKLLATKPLHQDPEDPENEFDEWLRWHLPTRTDGRWLADRTDPVPFDYPEWKNQKQDDQWRWSVQRADFDRVLGLGQDQLTLWGHWTTSSDRYQEIVSIQTALVSSDRADALLRATQTASDAHDFRIPSGDDELEFNHGHFQLKGWVDDRTLDRGVDSFDPWAGRIHYPGPRPAGFIRDLLKLTADEEGRIWKPPGDNAQLGAVYCQVWGEEPDEDQNGVESGSHIKASPGFIGEMLRKTGMAMIAKVTIERSIRRLRYERNTAEDYGYQQPYFRMYICDAERQWRTLGGRAGLGREDRQRAGA